MAKPAPQLRRSRRSPRLLPCAASATSFRLPLGHGTEAVYGFRADCATCNSSPGLVSIDRLLCRGPDRGALDFVADERLELGEIVLEPAAQAARDLVIGFLVLPGAAPVEHIVR